MWTETDQTKRTIGQTKEKDIDSNTNWGENRENENQAPETDNTARIQTECGPNYWNWWTGNNYWAENPGWYQNTGPPAKGMGGFAKCEMQNPAGITLRTDHWWVKSTKIATGI